MHTHLLKVGHFTMDNALNNDTMMQSLMIILTACDIDFDLVDHRIMCIAHIINLCSGWVVYVVTDGIKDTNDSSLPKEDTTKSNPIVQAHTVI
jgi:hypothetical protein